MLSLPQTSQAANTPSFTTMRPLPLPDAVRRAGCTSAEQLTPPPSPANRHCRRFRFRALPKLQIPKITSRQPQAARRGKHDILQATVSSGSSSDSSVVSSYIVKPFEHTPQSTPATTSSTPYELLQGENNKASSPHLELRRTPHSYYDLRGLAQEQRNKHQPPLPVTPSVHTPLLPSPIIDHYSMHTGNDPVTAFQFTNPRGCQFRKDETNYRSYDDMQILSCYEDMDVSQADINGDGSQSKNENLNIAGRYLPPMSVDSITSSDKPSMQRPSSAESDWLANTTSHAQRLRKFKSRCCQVVQHPMQINSLEEGEVGKVMLATVLVGPGRPRLVHITRPMSSTNSFSSRRSVSRASETLVETTSTISKVEPSTPVNQCKEVSAFSPYDTPSITTPFIDIAPHSHISLSKTSSNQTPLSASKVELVPQPLTLSRSASASQYGGTFSGATERRIRALAKSLSISPSIFSPNSTRISKTHDIDQRSPQPRRSPLSPSKLKNLEQHLDAITQAVNDFPHTMLSLEAPVLAEIYRPSTTSHRAHQLENLSKVFPDAPNLMLSMLAAWLIIDLHISSISHDKGPTNTSDSHSPPPSSQPHTSNRSASLSNPFASPRKPRRATTYSLFPNPQVPGSRPSSSRAGSKNLHLDSHMSSTDIPHMAIPDKARTLLGFDTDHEAWRSQEQLLMTHAHALSASVGVIAQKIIESLRGESGCWDPYLWKALRVLVATGEEGEMIEL